MHRSPAHAGGTLPSAGSKVPANPWRRRFVWSGGRDSNPRHPAWKEPLPTTRPDFRSNRFATPPFRPRQPCRLVVALSVNLRPIRRQLYAVCASHTFPVDTYAVTLGPPPSASPTKVAHGGHSRTDPGADAAHGQVILRFGPDVAANSLLSSRLAISGNWCGRTWWRATHDPWPPLTARATCDRPRRHPRARCPHWENHAGGSASPQRFAPRQATLPSARTPQAWLAPVQMEVHIRPLDRPLSPQASSSAAATNATSSTISPQFV